MKIIDLYKQMYSDEISRKTYENGRIGTTMLFVSLFITGIGVTITESANIKSDKILWFISIMLLFIALLFFLVSIYFAIRTYFGYGYYYLTPQEINDRYLALKEYYEENYDEYYEETGKEIDDLVSEDMEDGLIKNYADAVKNNFESNNRKAKYQRFFSNTIITGLMILALDLLILNINKIFK